MMEVDPAGKRGGDTPGSGIRRRLGADLGMEFGVRGGCGACRGDLSRPYTPDTPRHGYVLSLSSALLPRSAP